MAEGLFEVVCHATIIDNKSGGSYLVLVRFMDNLNKERGSIEAVL